MDLISTGTKSTYLYHTSLIFCILQTCNYLIKQYFYTLKNMQVWQCKETILRYSSLNYFTVLFFLKKSKLLKNGEAPICMRITVNGKRAEVQIKRSVEIEKWNSQKECAIGKDRITSSGVRLIIRVSSFMFLFLLQF